MIGTIYLVGCFITLLFVLFFHFSGSIEGLEKAGKGTLILFILKEVAGSWFSIAYYMYNIIVYGQSEEE